MRAEIISVGTELLLGEITDTNATYISQKLNAIGVDVLYRTTVGDNEGRIAAVVDAALNRVDLVIVGGGLGPTQDDVTREAIARATGRPLEFQQHLFDGIAARFEQYGVRMSANNQRQAYVPRGALPIDNPVGTAPIFILEAERGIVMVVPGVPREMEYLMESVLLPWVEARLEAPAVIRSRILRTIGIGESVLDERLGDLMTGTNPTVGLAAQNGQTDIRITAKAPTLADADALIEPVVQAIRSKLGTIIYGEGTQPIEAVVRPLIAGLSVNAVEINTGGQLAERLGIETQQYATLNDYPTPPPGKDLGEVALAMAGDVRNGADFGAAVVILTDEGGQRVAYAVVGDGYRNSRVFTWPAARRNAAIWGATHTMAMIRAALLKTTYPIRE